MSEQPDFISFGHTNWSSALRQIDELRTELTRVKAELATAQQDAEKRLGVIESVNAACHRRDERIAKLEAERDAAFADLHSANVIKEGIKDDRDAVYRDFQRVVAERDAALAERANLETYILNAHGKAWPATYTYTGWMTTIDLLVADLLATRVEKEAANQRADDAVAGMATARSAEMVEWPRCEASDESRGMRCEKPKGHEGEHYLVTANEWRAIFPLE